MNTTATTESMITQKMNDLSMNHDYYNHSKEHRYTYYIDRDNQKNELEVTAINGNSNIKFLEADQDWLEEIEHSFEPSNKLETIDFQDHQSIIQSYLEPTCVPQPHHLSLPPLMPQKSKFSQMKSRVKRVFRIPGANNKSLPVFSTPTSSVSTVNERWAPSIDSSICSSTTTAAATFQDTASTCSTKKYNRHSCGLSTASFKQNKPPVTKSFTPVVEVPPPPPPKVKSILKKQQVYSKPPPLILPRRRHSGGGFVERRKQQRWSRISITPSKRLSVVTMLKRKKSSRESIPVTNTVVKFNKYDNVHETWSRAEYDRSSDPDAVCTRLTANLAQHIKQELNHFKLHEMSVHDSSRIHTHFFL